MTRIALSFHMGITQKEVKKKTKIKIFTSIGDNSVNDLRFIKRKLRSKYLDHIPVNLKTTTIIFRFSKRETVGKRSSFLAALSEKSDREISRQHGHFSRRKTLFLVFLKHVIAPRNTTEKPPVFACLCFGND